MRSWEGKGENAAVTALERETLVTHAHIFLSFFFFLSRQSDSFRAPASGVGGERENIGSP